LLRSRPGGFSGSWSIKTYPIGKINKAVRNHNLIEANIKDLAIFVPNQIFCTMIHPYAYRAGLIAAGISVVWTIFSYLIGIELFTNWWLSIIISVGIIVYLIISLKNIRTYFGGYITFANAFLNFLVMIAIFVLISQSIYYLLILVIDPEFGQAVTDVSIEKIIAMMEGFGAPEVEIEKALVGMEEEFENQATFLGVIMSMFKGIGFMAVIGLIVAAIIKKNPPVFENAETID